MKFAIVLAAALMMSSVVSAQNAPASSKGQIIAPVEAVVRNEPQVEFTRASRGQGHMKHELQREIQYVPGTPQCGNGRSLIIEGVDEASPAHFGQLVILEIAALKGKPLKVHQARCVGGKDLVVKSISLEPEPFEVRDPCDMPFARTRLPECRGK